MVDIATIGTSVLLSVLGSVALTEYRLRRKQSVQESAEIDEWYADSRGYAAEVRRTWQRLFDTPDRPSMNLDELQSQMSLLEGQISRHASAGEQLGTDENVIEALDELAQECRQLTAQTLHMDSAGDFAEHREDILGAVESLEESLEDR